MSDPIQSLARKCADRGLRLNQARALFEALIVADALALDHGCILRAAERLEVKREFIHRRLKVREDT